MTNGVPRGSVLGPVLFFLFFGLLNANSLLVMRLCAYYGGYGNRWREAHLEAHKRVLHFFATTDLKTMLVTGTTTIVSLSKFWSLKFNG